MEITDLNQFDVYMWLNSNVLLVNKRLFDTINWIVDMQVHAVR